jgi:trimeric autotransporter adhesin
MGKMRAGLLSYRILLCAGISAAALATVAPGALAHGAGAVQIGDAPADNGTSIGKDMSPGETNAIAVGRGANASPLDNTAVTFSGTATSNSGVTAISSDSITDGLNSSMLGRAANSAGNTSVGAGAAVASSTSVGAIAVGANTHDPAFCRTANPGIGVSTQ